MPKFLTFRKTSRRKTGMSLMKLSGLLTRSSSSEAMLGNTLKNWWGISDVSWNQIQLQVLKFLKRIPLKTLFQLLGPWMWHIWSCFLDLRLVPTWGWPDCLMDRLWHSRFSNIAWQEMLYQYRRDNTLMTNSPWHILLLS